MGLASLGPAQESSCLEILEGTRGWRQETNSLLDLYEDLEGLLVPQDLTCPLMEARIEETVGTESREGSP